MHFERDPRVINQLYKTSDEITAEDIKAIANKYLVDNARTTVTMSALDKAPNFEQEVDLNALVAKLEQAPQAAAFKVLDKTNSSPLIDVNFLFNTGAAADPQGKKGLGALPAAMLAQGGSQSTSYKDFKQALYPVAGSLGYK